MPENLVPSCRDCNTEKSTSFSSNPQDQSLHPYYDHSKFVSDLWLYARVIETDPTTFEFYAHAPDDWDSISKRRVLKHMEDYKLNDRFTVLATDELPAIQHQLTKLGNDADSNIISQFLISKCESYENTHKNSWQGAMYRALAESVWYCEDGFKLSSPFHSNTYTDRPA